MFRHLAMTLFLAGLLLSGVPGPASAEDSQEDCLACHAEKTPGVVGYWERSAHRDADVGCEACHGSDVKAAHSGERKVLAPVCARCHEEAGKGHSQGRHGVALKTGHGCTRNLPAATGSGASCSFCHETDSGRPRENSECSMFLAQSPEMQLQGCLSCHKVENRCDTCHTVHGTDLAMASEAETCGTCHMGPDHAQYEMWKSSRHGVIFKQRGMPDAPTCVTCHMYKGTHDVSRGIATGRPADTAVSERGFMLDICSRCHTRKFSRLNLEEADAIQRQSLALLAEAEEVVRKLHGEGLLMPMPSERPEHPIFKKKFTLGPLMTYEDISRPEANFFRMMKFHYVSAYKGAFHQNPDYTHWYGNAPLKLALAELKSDAMLLRKLNTVEDRLDNLAAGGALRAGTTEEDELEALKSELRALKERLLKSEITPQEHKALKAKLLDNMGL